MDNEQQNWWNPISADRRTVSEKTGWAASCPAFTGKLQGYWIA